MKAAMPNAAVNWAEFNNLTLHQVPYTHHIRNNHMHQDQAQHEIFLQATLENSIHTSVGILDYQHARPSHVPDRTH